MIFWTILTKGSSDAAPCHHRLRRDFAPGIELSKSQLETLCLIVVGMISARTVNLSHLASERPSTALIASTYRRLQRFFQHVRLGSLSGRRRW